MAKTVKIKLSSTTSSSTGPTFDLYSDANGYSSAFETGVSKTTLMSSNGYTSTVVPDSATIIRVKSVGVCTSYDDYTLSIPTATPTPTPTPTVIGPTATPTPTPTATGTPAQLIYNSEMGYYPVTAGSASNSGFLVNTTSNTYYISLHFNSGGQSSGYVYNDSATIDTTTTLTIPSDTPISGNGTDFYSAYYYTLQPNTTVEVSIVKQDGYSSGASLSLMYSSYPGGSRTQVPT